MGTSIRVKTIVSPFHVAMTPLASLLFSLFASTVIFLEKKEMKFCQTYKSFSIGLTEARVRCLSTLFEDPLEHENRFAFVYREMHKNLIGAVGFKYFGKGEKFRLNRTEELDRNIDLLYVQRPDCFRCVG